MKSDYLVKVLSSNIVDGDELSDELITHANLTGSEEDYTITYTEDNEGLPVETVVRVLGGECVTVRRRAEIETDMVIEVGKKHISEHKLPFGSFNLEVIGNSITSEMKSGDVNLHFAYTTYQDNMPLGKASFTMIVRKKGRHAGVV